MLTSRGTGTLPASRLNPQQQTWFEQQIAVRRHFGVLP